MAPQTTKLVIFVLLIAAAAFVIDVLSPLTPTPNAIGVRLLLTLQLFVVLVSLVDPIISTAREFFLHRHYISSPRAAQRTLIALICILLC